MGWKDHRLIEDGAERFCAQCAEPWPCPTARLVAEVRADVREVQATDPTLATPNRIIWEHDTGPGRNIWIGRVGDKPLFSVHHSAVRDGGRYNLRTRLPWNFAHGRDEADEVAELKGRAEVVLDAFVRKLGAVWPPVQPEPVKEADA